MRDTLVLTVIGPDRTGLVEALADRVAAAGGNWEASHMSRLAGQFAGILLVAVDRTRTEELVASLSALDAHGLHVVARPAPAEAVVAPAGTRMQLTVTGNDRPGIVRDVARLLTAQGLNIEELESEVQSAPMSGDAMFVARAVLQIPPRLALTELRRSLEALAGELMVDLSSADPDPAGPPPRR
jgi:glycine cleavage system regulatory protein